MKLVSIITKTSAKNPALKKGNEVYGVIKASKVMIATDGSLFAAQEYHPPG